MVSPDQQRAAADYLSERYGVSERRVCRVIGRSRSVLRYRRSRRVDEPALSKEIKRLARRHPRYGYRRIHALLVRRGWSVNVKRVAQTVDDLGAATATEAEKTQETWPQTLSFTHISLLTEVLTAINLAAIFHNTVHLFKLLTKPNENTITV